jgi:cell division transport system ATP-binding protein
MISFENVTKIYEQGAKPALDNVTFNISKSEFVFLVGSSGSGKSTLLSLILRELKPESGEIFVAGKDLQAISNMRVPKFRRLLGVVFQGFRLLPRKTVYENVAFALEVIGSSKSTISNLVPLALKTVGLEGKEERMPHELSGGEQQRVAIARAIVNKPPILLADEPTGNLDPTTSGEIMKVLKQVNANGTTILMATHNEEIVNQERRRVLELSGGHLIRDELSGTYDSSVEYNKLHNDKLHNSKLQKDKKIVNNQKEIIKRV